MMTIAIGWGSFNANLLGESKGNFGTRWGSQFGFTFLNWLLIISNIRNSDTFFLRDVLTGDNRKRDGLVDAYADSFGVGNLNSNTVWCDNRGIVLGDLRYISAVLLTISAITSMTISWGLTLRDISSMFWLFECHFDSGGNSIISLFTIFVGADFVGNGFVAFSTDSAGDGIALFFIDDFFDIEKPLILENFLKF